MKMFDTAETLRIFTALGVVREGHFVGTSGRHLDHYFDKNKIFPDPLALERLSEELAARCLGDDVIEVVIAPAIGGAFVAQRVAYRLRLLQGSPVTFVFAENPNDEGFRIKRGQEQGLKPGAKTLAVEDVITTGKSIRDGAIDLARALDLNVVAAAALCNRGKTAADLGITGPIYSLLDIAWPSWEATQEDPCPLCEQGVPINTDVGHGKQYLEQLRGAHRIEGGMPSFT